MSLRSQLINDPRFDVDRYAQQQGFPNSHAMEAVLKAGAELRATGRITEKTARNVAAQYDPAMAARVEQVVDHINKTSEQHGRFNALDALITVVGGPEAVERGRSLIEHYQDAEIASSLMERRGAVDTKTTRVEDVNSIRNNLLRATAPKTDKLPTEILADAAEAAINKVDMVQRAPSIHSLRDTIEAHVDHAIVSEQLGEIDNASDLNDSIAPPDSTP